MDLVPYSVPVMISRLEAHFAYTALATAGPDPSPFVLELKVMLLRKLTDPNIQLMGKGHRKYLNCELTFFTEFAYLGERISWMLDTDDDRTNGAFPTDITVLMMKLAITGLCEPKDVELLAQEGVQPQYKGSI